MRRPLIKGFEPPLICPSGTLDFVLDYPPVSFGSL